MVTLVRIQTVLRHWQPSQVDPRTEIFVQETGEGDDGRPYRMGVPRDIWGDLGEPEYITVTIDPGDRLNGG